MAEIGIKVSVRCRPFTIDDELGVIMTQSEEEAGDVELINCDYTKTFSPSSTAGGRVMATSAT